MASLLEIKKQIQGVKNTKKITKAMQLVAASKMKNFQRKAVGAREFVMNLLEALDSTVNAGVETIYSKAPSSGKILFVLYTSDKGLCGALNNKQIKALVNSAEWKTAGESGRLLVTIGKKATEFARNNNIPVEKDFVGLPEGMTNIDALGVVDQILEMWKGGEIREIKFVAPFYVNSFTFYPQIKTFLPFSKEMVETNLRKEESKDSKSSGNNNMIFNSDPEDLTERLHELIVQGLFVQSFMELKASEYSSRMMAMKNATDAADKKRDELSLIYNKARQQAITQEIAELMGGSAAVSE
jgi:F-type H+-transporting ATPase subunit gamma